MEKRIRTKVLNQIVAKYHGLKAVVKGYLCLSICYDHGLQSCYNNGLQSYYNHGLQAVVMRTSDMGGFSPDFFF